MSTTEPANPPPSKGKLRITHNHEDGTLLHGTVKGDGVYELIGPRTAARFKWFRSIGAIGIPQSRDRVAKRHQINTAARILCEAGWEVDVDIDDTPRDQERVLQDKAERLDDRQEALDAKAAKRRAEADSTYDTMRREAQAVPLGQPILIGHHSERRLRAHYDRQQRLGDRWLDEMSEADRVERRAAAVGTNLRYAGTPLATSRRIDNAEKEIKLIAKKLEGYVRNFRDGHGQIYMRENHPPASGDHKATLEARRAQLELQLEYDRAKLAEAVAEGKWTAHGPTTIKPGDYIRSHGFWRKVVKVNKKTVGCESGYSWLDKVPYVDITAQRGPDFTPETTVADIRGGGRRTPAEGVGSPTAS